MPDGQIVNASCRTLREQVRAAPPPGSPFAGARDPKVGLCTALARTIQTLKTYGGTNSNGSPRHEVWMNEFGRLTPGDDQDTPEVNKRGPRARPPSSTGSTVSSTGCVSNRAAWNLGPVFW
jgi:hypothetical protein